MTHKAIVCVCAMALAVSACDNTRDTTGPVHFASDVERGTRVPEILFARIYDPGESVRVRADSFSTEVEWAYEEWNDAWHLANDPAILGVPEGEDSLVVTIDTQHTGSSFCATSSYRSVTLRRTEPAPHCDNWCGGGDDACVPEEQLGLLLLHEIGHAIGYAFERQ